DEAKDASQGDQRATKREKDVDWYELTQETGQGKRDETHTRHARFHDGIYTSHHSTRRRLYHEGRKANVDAALGQTTQKVDDESQHEPGLEGIHGNANAQ